MGEKLFWYNWCLLFSVCDFLKVSAVGFFISALRNRRSLSLSLSATGCNWIEESRAKLIAAAAAFGYFCFRGWKRFPLSTGRRFKPYRPQPAASHRQTYNEGTFTRLCCIQFHIWDVIRKHASENNSSGDHKVIRTERAISEILYAKHWSSQNSCNWVIE